MDRRWWTLLAASVATFMLLLDVTVVNTALPSIRRELGADFDELQWVVDAYTLTLAAVVLTAGTLADRFGRRRVFVAGLGMFSAASLLAGLAPDPTLLNVARALQGVGGAMMFAVSLALIAQEFPAGRERAGAMSVYGATIGVALAVGPLVGGALTEGLGWEWIFLLNAPIGAATIAIACLRLRESRGPSVGRVDWAGLVTFSGALFLLVLGLLRGNDEGWASLPIVAELAGAAALLAAFLVIERRVAEPMLPLELFRRPAFVGVQLAMFAVSSTMFALYLYVTLYLQGYLGHSPLEAGIRFLPIMTMAFVVSSLTGPLVARVHTSVLLGTGLALTGAGLLLMAGIDTGSSWTTLLAGWLLGGAGVGLLNPVIADAAVSVVPKERSGMAAGINNTFRQVGVAVGVAAWGAVFLSRGADRASELVAGTSAAGDERSSQLVEAVSAGQLGPAVAALPPSARESAADAAREGFVAGLNSVLTMGGALAIAGAAIALWLVRREPSGHRRHETTGPSCEGGVSPPGSHTVTPVVLVHGNWHGSWCWSLVCEDLAARGISSVAVDLEGHGLRGPSPKSRWSRPFDAWSYAAEPSPAASVTASSAAQNLTEQLRRIGRGRPCVVVAHSMGGVVATAAAEQAPELVAAVVYIAAFVPVRGLPAASYFGLPENEGSMVALGLAADPAAVDAFRYDTGNPASREVIRETFYNDVDPAMADAATALITSDAPAGIAGEAITVTPDRFGTVPHAFVVCARDNAVRPALQRLAVAEVDAVSAHPTEVVELDASHAPFLSMPARLGEIIENVAWRSRIRRSPERFLR